MSNAPLSWKVTLEEHAAVLREVEEHRKQLAADLLSTRRAARQNRDAAAIAEKRIADTLKYLSGCAVMRMEPSKHHVKSLLEGKIHG